MSDHVTGYSSTSAMETADACRSMYYGPVTGSFSALLRSSPFSHQHQPVDASTCCVTERRDDERLATGDDLVDTTLVPYCSAAVQPCYSDEEQTPAFMSSSSIVTLLHSFTGAVTDCRAPSLSYPAGERQFIHSLIHSKKVKASDTRYRALGPELIPVYRQSTRR